MGGERGGEHHLERKGPGCRNEKREKDSSNTIWREKNGKEQRNGRRGGKQK